MKLTAIVLALCCVAATTQIRLEKLWENGSADESGYWYGLVKDAGLLEDGRVVVLDEGNQRLVMLSEAGSVIAEIGRAGRGPGEFESPVDMEVDPGDRILVLDVAVGRITVAEATEDYMVHRDSWVPPINISAFCTLGDRVFGVSAGGIATPPGQVIHELPWAGQFVTNSFGPTEVKSQRPQIAGASGKLLCLDEDQLILFLPHYYPQVHAFRPNGDQVWTATLPDYLPVTIEGGQGWVRYSAENGYHDTGAELAATSEVAIVQWAKVRRGVNRNEAPSVSTAVVSLSDGKVLELKAEFPRIASAGHGALVGYTNSPFPKVLKYREVDE